MFPFALEPLEVVPLTERLAAERRDQTPELAAAEEEGSQLGLRPRRLSPGEAQPRRAGRRAHHERSEHMAMTYSQAAPFTGPATSTCAPEDELPTYREIARQAGPPLPGEAVPARLALDLLRLRRLRVRGDRGAGADRLLRLTARPRLRRVRRDQALTEIARVRRLRPAAPVQALEVVRELARERKQLTVDDCWAHVAGAAA